MTATLTLDDQGRITLPEAIKRAFGIRPGAVLRAEVSRGRLEIQGELPVVSEGVLEDGMLMLPKLGITVDAAAAIRAERESQAERALGR
jgi:bifunctional DNA-binding transcriptional regulator/antitoxin component of YhaV-PrlF toxin-antitoxin module